MKRSVYILGSLAIAGALTAVPARAADILIGGKLYLGKAAGLVKVLSKDASLTPGVEDPTVSGATLHVFDEGTTGGDLTIPLPAGSWTALGAGKFKYKGSGCKIVILKAGLLKAVCKGVVQTPPYTGNAGAVLTVGTDNYCMEFLVASAKKNTDKLVKILDASAPAMCPSVGPPGCPLAAGEYTVTQLAGGTLNAYIFAAFPFPAGGFIVQDVAAASLPDCVHDVVVPDPGGFSAPNFCVPALGLTTRVTQNGCGAGLIDSNGGSDFTIDEVGDTSDGSGTCPATFDQTPGCVNGTDSHMRNDVTVGNAMADVCGSGTANALVSIPVHTQSWSDTATSSPCTSDGDCSGATPKCHMASLTCSAFVGCAGDAVYGGESFIADFFQILDFTTDKATEKFMDIDGDGCSAASAGTGGPFTATGVCMDIGAGTVTTVASGVFGSTGPPFFDGAFSTKLPNTVSSTGPFLGTVCASPPAITVPGLTTRCIP